VPKQNRVTPFGDLIETSARGTFMGNRGILHDAKGTIRRPWQVKRWLVCVLEFRGRRRVVMNPNSYTELFFLDEATALAAGHRPCSECRHARFIAYCRAWRIAHPGQAERPGVSEIDNRLHAERLDSDGAKQLFLSTLDELPDGVLVTAAEWGEQAFLVWGDSLLAWSPGGYHKHQPRPIRIEVQVLTPGSTVAVIRAGYLPEIHPSAMGLV
jgi:hypothetical protein